MSIAFLGNAASAAGFRLAGAIAFAPGHDGIAAAFERALAAADVVIIDAGIATRIPAPRLEAALARLRPLVVIAPSNGVPVHRLEPAERVRRQLGLET